MTRKKEAAILASEGRNQLENNFINWHWRFEVQQFVDSVPYWETASYLKDLLKKATPDKRNEKYMRRAVEVLEAFPEDYDEILLKPKRYDLFISHANKDKKEYVQKLYKSLCKLGIAIFYDEDVIEWGDPWKEQIFNGLQECEFGIVVISNNYFGREWTEKELKELFNKQNKSGQKVILPLLLDVPIETFKEKYPFLEGIQAVSTKENSVEQIALLFARQLIKRLKS